MMAHDTDSPAIKNVMRYIGVSVVGWSEGCALDQKAGEFKSMSDCLLILEGLLKKDVYNAGVLATARGTEPQ